MNQNGTIHREKTIILFLLICLFSTIILQAADVTAPSLDNIYTFTVKNIGTVKMENVVPSASVSQNPQSIVSIKNITPISAEIAAGGLRDFQIRFDVGAPAIPLNGITTAKFKMSISTTKGSRN